MADVCAINPSIRVDLDRAAADGLLDPIVVNDSASHFGDLDPERVKLKKIRIGKKNPTVARFADDGRNGDVVANDGRFTTQIHGPYRVALKSDDTAVGTCGLFRRKGLNEADIGYGFLPEFCQRGYAYESARAVLEHARSDIGLTRIIAIVSPDNAASIGLTEKLGLQFEKTTRLPGEDKDVSVYSMSLQA